MLSLNVDEELKSSNGRTVKEFRTVWGNRETYQPTLTNFKNLFGVLAECAPVVEKNYSYL